MSLIVKLGLTLAILAVLSGIGAGIYNAGARAERAKFAERDNRALKAAIEERDKALAKVRDLEKQSAADAARAEQEASNEIRKGDQALASALADVRSGKLRLRNLARSCAAEARPGSGAAPGAVAAAAVDGAQARLPGADEEFLVRLAREADELVTERNECVAIARRDRERQAVPRGQP